MPSTTSPMRPEKIRAVSWRERARTTSRRRMRGIMTIWTRTIVPATRPSQKFCRTMKNSAVSAWLINSAGSAKALPPKPPTGSVSSLIIEAISEPRTCLKRPEGKRSTRSTS
ncbi:hypothetical protein OH818_12105 [Jiella pelagia]|uniref:Uncharacterized protein n=1 Tax=Jiella pelagia TaxID=2986949 RepID=A0ABY7C629_9HYPH|nr:hypothetical protein [Jiella pelagia]WAP70686.1 hypothetical protein OH818_12105 [Jiella pelagia]